MAFPVYTYTFTNGQSVDATQCMQNWNDILNGVTDTTKDVSVNALTTAGNVILGNASAKTITFTGSLASNIPVSANTSWDFGSATLGMKSVYIGGTSTFTTRIMSAATASWTFNLPVTAGTSGQLLQTDGSGNTSWTSPTVFQNLLVNGAFDYWQVGTSKTVTATGGASPSATYLYLSDQWYANNILGGGTVEGIITYSQVAGVTNGSIWGAKLQISTAPTGTGIQNGCELYQLLSNPASYPLYNKTASFSVLVKSLGTVTQVGVQFYYATTETKLTTAIGAEVLTTVNSSTFTACTISGQALGTSQTVSGVVGVRIRITGVSSGNTYDLNNGFICEQAMLNLGSSALPFSRQFNDPSQELQACQRFYSKSFPIASAPAQSFGYATGNPHWFVTATAGAYTHRATFYYPVTMRTAPAITFYNPNAANALATNIGAGTDSSTSTATAGESGARAEITGPAGWAVAQSVVVQWSADARI